MSERVCVDASLVLMLLLPEQRRVRARALWDGWVEAGSEVVSPPLFFAEVTSVLRLTVYLGRIDDEEGEEAFSAFIDLGVSRVEPADLQPRAWALARQFNRPRAYDAQYLAVAESLQCDLWTADERLVNAVAVPWLRGV